MPESGSFYAVQGGQVIPITIGFQVDEKSVEEAGKKSSEILHKEMAKTGTVVGGSLGSSIETELSQRLLGMSTLTPASLIGAIMGGLGISYSIQQFVRDLKELYQESVKIQVDTTAHAVWGGTETEATRKIEGWLQNIAGKRDEILGVPVKENPFYVKELGDAEKLLNEMASRGYKFEDIIGTPEDELRRTIGDFLTIIELSNAVQMPLQTVAELMFPIARHLQLTNDEWMKQLGVIQEIGKESMISLPTATEQVLKLANAYEEAGYSAEKAVLSAGELRLALPKVPIEDLQTLMSKLTPSTYKEELKLASLIGLPANMEGVKKLETMETGEILKLVNEAIDRMSGGKEDVKRILAEKYLGVSGYALQQVSQLTSQQIDDAIKRAREAPPLQVSVLPYESLFQRTFANWWRSLVIELGYGVSTTSQGYGIAQPYVPKLPIPLEKQLGTAIPSSSVVSPTYSPTTNININIEKVTSEEVGKTIADYIIDAIENQAKEKNLPIPINP
jgi:hypothetical protein